MSASSTSAREVSHPTGDRTDKPILTAVSGEWYCPPYLDVFTLDRRTIIKYRETRFCSTQENS